MAVFGLVSAVAGFVKVRYLLEKAIIDNVVFRAHYRITSAILFVCCIVVTANNLIGEPIMCINDSIASHVMATYCWITHTFTLPREANTSASNLIGHLGNDHNRERRYHSYYQWVPFVLFFQGCCFYVPHWIWKNWEDGKMRAISEGLRGVQTGPKDERVQRQRRLVKYIFDSKRTHNGYAFGYFFCEALNFVNVIANIIAMDRFLGGAFMTYGMEVWKFSNMNQEDRSDPMVEIFPRITKCTFHKYGASGTLQHHDAMCVLALNILNEKIYIFLWFWLIALAVASGVAMLYSAVVVMMPTTRETIIKRRFRYGTNQEVKSLIRNIRIGDFLMLHLLGQNINVHSYSAILSDLSQRLNGSPGTGPGTPSAPSTMEMAPMYSNLELNEKEAMA